MYMFLHFLYTHIAANTALPPKSEFAGELSRRLRFATVKIDCSVLPYTLLAVSCFFSINFSTFACTTYANNILKLHSNSSNKCLL